LERDRRAKESKMEYLFKVLIIGEPGTGMN